MPSVNFSPDQRDLLVELVASSYRRQHREAWEARLGGARSEMTEAQARLDSLAQLLSVLGSSVDEAMRPVMAGHVVPGTGHR